MLKTLMIVTCLTCCYTMQAQVQLAPVFTDHMVIQRGKPVTVYGKGIPGSRVEVVIKGKKKTVRVSSDSSWLLRFGKQAADTVPQNIIVQCSKQQIVVRDILIGDVWVCSGQSNMEFPFSREVHAKQEIQSARQPLIRLYNASFAGKYVYGVAYTDSIFNLLNTSHFYKGKWEACDSNTVKPMSAIAYYFAKKIVAYQRIPIGLINLAIGGAPIETFISAEALQKSSQFAKKVQGNWLTNPDLPEWIRERGGQNIKGHVQGFGDELGLNHAYKPGFAYASGIAPLLSFPIKGVLWYQGESNSLEAARVNEYKALMHLLISSYREGWHQQRLPFYWVQLSSIDTPYYHSEYWPQFRDLQRQLVYEIKDGGMAVCSDLGFKKDVHPTNKKDVGERLALWALVQDYGVSLVPSGPLPVKANYEKGKVIIRFKYASDSLITADGKALRGFSLDGKTEIKALISKKNIVIPLKEQPEYVYYGWKPFTDANLINADHLPASTFKIKVQ